MENSRFFAASLIAVAGLLAGAILAFDLSLPLGIAGAVPYVVLVGLGWYGGIRTIVALALLSTLLTALGYLYSPEGGTHWMVLVNRFLALFAIWATAALLIVAKRATGKVADSEKRLSELLALAPEAVISIGADQRIEIFNKGAEEIFGYRPQEVLGRPVHMLLPRRFRDAHGGQLARFAETPGDSRPMGLQRKIIGLRKDGTEFPARGAISALALAGETSFTLMLYDCSQEQESQQRMAALARFPDENPSPVLRVEADGTVHYANPAAHRIAALFEDHGTGVLADGVAREVAHARRSGAPRELEIVAGERTYALTVTAVAGESYLNLYGRDITERKQAEVALRQAHDGLEKRVRERTRELAGANRVLLEEVGERERAEAALQASKQELQEHIGDLEMAQFRLEEQGSELVSLAEDLELARDHAEVANRTKSEFLAAMSHELRTPLNAIIGFSEIIKNETFGPVGSAKYREYSGDIYDSGQHLLGLINDILDLAKIEAGTDELHEEEIEIPDLVRAGMKLVERRAEQGGVKLAAAFREPLPVLRADERKLKQILVNLLSNAVKFTRPGGTVSIGVWCDKDDGFVFEVADSGIGIPAADIAKALSRFGQVDSDLSRRGEGTGLGLPLSKSLAELHGGTLELQSEAGTGTTVTVRFPPARIVPAPADSAPRSAAAGT